MRSDFFKWHKSSRFVHSMCFSYNREIILTVKFTPNKLNHRLKHSKNTCSTSTALMYCVGWAKTLYYVHHRRLIHGTRFYLLSTPEKSSSNYTGASGLCDVGFLIFTIKLITDLDKIYHFAAHIKLKRRSRACDQQRALEAAFSPLEKHEHTPVMHWKPNLAETKLQTHSSMTRLSMATRES